MESVRARLSSPNGRHLSSRGRVVLINSVLNSIPLYLLSFYERPKVVFNEFIKMQRNFLWGDHDDGRKICWVAWDQFVNLKKKGG